MQTAPKRRRGRPTSLILCSGTVSQDSRARYRKMIRLAHKRWSLPDERKIDLVPGQVVRTGAGCSMWNHVTLCLKLAVVAATDGCFCVLKFPVKVNSPANIYRCTDIKPIS